MIDINHTNTYSGDVNTNPSHFIQAIKPSAKGLQPSLLPTTPNKTEIEYLISQDLIRIILPATLLKTTGNKANSPTELIFPRAHLSEFSFSDTESRLEYQKGTGTKLTISILPRLQLVKAVLTQDNKQTSPSFSKPLTTALQAHKKTILFTQFIKKGWALDKKIALNLPKKPLKAAAEPETKTEKQAVILPPKSQPLADPAPSAEQAKKAQVQLPLTNDPKSKAIQVKPEKIAKQTTKPSATIELQEKKKDRNRLSQTAVFHPAKILDKQLLRTSLKQLQADTKLDKIYRHFLEHKKKKILQKITPRIKPGTTLSSFYPDYQKYNLIKKTSLYQEQNIEPSNVQSGYYIWQEDNRIITSSSTKLMPLRVAENILQKHMSLHSLARPTRGAYLKQIDGTYLTALKRPYALDKKSLARLRILLRKARIELLKNDSNFALSPGEYGQVLTNLRSWVTYDYLKKFSVKKFDRYFKTLERIQGRGRYTHIKLTQILGLQDTGRIIANRDFLNQYHFAIEKAAKKYPRIPKKWIEQIIWIETKGDPRSISHAGAYGVMQLLPDVFIGKGEERARYYTLSFVKSINPFNVAQNIERGTAFLDSLMTFLKPVISQYPIKTQKQILFHSYNRGPTKVKQMVKQYGLGYVKYLPRETKLYLERLNDFPL